MKWLALDLATVCGFAIGDTGARDYLFGSKRILGGQQDELGPYAADFAEWLGGSIRAHGIEKVGFEAPVLPPKTQIATLERLYGLKMVTELVCFRAGVPVVQEHMQTVRRHFMGAGWHARKGDIKVAICKQCRLLGYRVGDDHNAADAVALLDYLLALEQPARALSVTPMFADRC